MNDIRSPGALTLVMAMASAMACLAPGLPLTAAAEESRAKGLTVQVEGLSTPEGHVMVALFDGPEGFADDTKALRRERLPIDDGLGAVWVVDDLPPGDYGVALYHDIDDDQELDRNFVGMPKEPYGFSNNARGTFGPPDYAETAFSFEGQPLVISIRPK